MTDFPRMNFRHDELWPWFKAVCSYDWAESKPLAELIRSTPIPPEFREAIANIVIGERKPKLKAAVKSKIPAEERLDIADAVSVILEICQAIAKDKEKIERIADRDRVEPIVVIRKVQGVARDTIESVAI